MSSSSNGGSGSAENPTSAAQVQMVQLIGQMKDLQPEFGHLMKKLLDTEKEFERKREKLQHQKEDNERQHQLKIQELKEWKAQQECELSDKHNELERNKKIFEEKQKWEKEQLAKDWKDLEERQKTGDDIAHQQEPVTVEVGGEKFRTELSTLTKCKESIFPDLVKALERQRESGSDHGRSKQRDPYIFIDRDGRHFRFILNFLRQGEQVLRGSALKKFDEYDFHDLLSEVRYYRLSELERLLSRKAASCRKQVSFQALFDQSCFRPITTAAASRVAQSQRQYKFITAKNILLKNENLRGIVFDHVIFEHKISFEDSLLVEAQFIECSFRSAINMHNADLFRATFDYCEGLDLATRFNMDKADTTEIKIIPSIDDS